VFIVRLRASRRVWLQSIDRTSNYYEDVSRSESQMHCVHWPLQRRKTIFTVFRKYSETTSRTQNRNAKIATEKKDKTMIIAWEHREGVQVCSAFCHWQKGHNRQYNHEVYGKGDELRRLSKKETPRPKMPCAPNETRQKPKSGNNPPEKKGKMINIDGDMWMKKQ
jgi:hypothetical protein